MGLESGIRKKPIPDPGSRGQKGTGSRNLNPDLQHCLYVMERRFFTSVRFFEENSWPLDCVRKKETVETLADLVHPQILSQVFDFIHSVG
jgi:hypothetical protein